MACNQLQDACWRGNYAEAKTYIKCADPNNDKYSLFFACTNTNNTKIVKLLLENGYDPLEQNGLPIFTAINHDADEILFLLINTVCIISKEMVDQMIHSASINGSRKCLRVLINKYYPNVKLSPLPITINFDTLVMIFIGIIIVITLMAYYLTF